MIIRTGTFPNTINPQQNQVNQQADSTNKDSKNVENLNNAANSINAESSIDNSKKVESLKERINNDDYKIDTQKTADKMAQDLLFAFGVIKL